MVITNSDDAEYLRHVVPGVLFDDGDDLTELLEKVFTHTSVTSPNHAEKWRHYLFVREEGRKEKGRGRRRERGSGRDEKTNRGRGRAAE